MKYFGTDGIRGKYNEKITNELAYKLGKSLKKLNVNKLVVGTDTRQSKDDLAYFLISGAIDSGIEVIYAGVVPTPALIYYSKLKNILGVMITASHNPYYDNGLKVLNKGVKLSLEEELLIESEIDNITTINKHDIKIELDNDVELEYIKFLTKHIFTSKYSVTIDCANGATFKTAPSIFDKITSNLFITADKPDGVNINEGVGSTHLSHLKDVMSKNGSTIGFSFDGDGDRILAVEDGKVIDGDQIIYIIANYFKEKKLLNKNTIVLTKMSNLGILNKLQELDINYSLVDVGDKYVVRELLANQYSIGGENSGHIIMPDILSTGDGVLVAMTLLKIMTETNKTLLQLLDGIEMYADKMVNLEVEDKSIINSKEVQNKIKEIEEKLIDCKVIVRASGTENLIRVTVMAKTIDLVNKYIEELVQLIKR